jgi:hypothetical protein
VFWKLHKYEDSYYLLCAALRLLKGMLPAEHPILNSVAQTKGEWDAYMEKERQEEARKAAELNDLERTKEGISLPQSTYE